MNTLDTKTRALILRLLVEGNSIRATTRIANDLQPWTEEPT